MYQSINFKVAYVRPLSTARVMHKNETFANSYLMRIPIRVKNNDSIGGLQIQPQSTSASRKHENKIFGAFSIEEIHKLSTHIRISAAIQAQILPFYKRYAQWRS